MILQERADILWAAGGRFSLDDIFDLRSRLKHERWSRAVIDFRDCFKFPKPIDLSILFVNPVAGLRIACLIPPGGLPAGFHLLCLTDFGRHSHLNFFTDNKLAMDWLASNSHSEAMRCS